MMMKDSGVAWIGDVPRNWAVLRTKHVFRNHKDVVGARESEYERLALTLNGVIKRSKTDSNGLQPEKFDGYQIVHSNELIFKLIDLANVSTSRVGLSPYEGIVSPAYIVLYPHQPSCLKFAEYFFYSLWQREVFNHNGDEGVRSSLSADTLLNIPYVCPSVSEQQRIANFLDAKCATIDDVIAKTNESIEEYKKLKQAVITEAVTKGVRGERPMKDSGIDWIGQIPKDWTRTKLNRICSFHNGDRSKNYPSPNDFVDEGIPFIGADSLNGLEVNNAIAKHIMEQKYNSMGGLKISKFDILYTLRGSTIGKNAMSMFDGGTVASSLMGIRVKSFNTLYPRFLLFWLQSEHEFIQRDMCINGSTAPNLSAEDVAAFISYMPSLGEQREIADYLDSKCAAIDTLISKKQQFIDELTAYKKSLIYEYVTGKKEVPA